MRIEVAELEPGQVLRAAFRETIASEGDELTFDAPVTGDVEITRTKKTVHLRAMLETSVPVACGRCLTGFRHHLVANLDEEFPLEPEPDPPAGEYRLDVQDFMLTIGPDMALDVTDVIRQHLLLAAPMVALCRPECRGLCPQCGTNLNEYTCSCRAEQIDPRLLPLRQLKGKLPAK